MATVDHGIGAEAETFFAAVHEIGHVAVLPNSFKVHVSLKNPCSLCPEGEGKAYSLAHVGHRSDTALDPIPEILYSLSGGAAEIACGLNPVQVKFSYGTFPQSMGQDFIDLKAEMTPSNGTQNTFQPILGRVLAIVETLLTSTLFGLFLLAIRRQFRR